MPNCQSLITNCQKLKYLEKNKNAKQKSNFVNIKFRNSLCPGFEFAIIKFTHYLNYYIYQSETLTRRSMHPNSQTSLNPLALAQFSSQGKLHSLENTFACTTFDQTLPSNQCVGGPSQTLITPSSALSKYTKSTCQQSQFISDNRDEIFFLDAHVKKCYGKMLKKEMKNCKIIQKKDHKKQMNQKTTLNNLILAQTFENQQTDSEAFLFKQESRKLASKNQSLPLKIQKLTDSKNQSQEKINYKREHSSMGAINEESLRQNIFNFARSDITGLNYQSRLSEKSALQNVLENKSQSKTEDGFGFSNQDYFISDILKQLEEYKEKKSKSRQNNKTFPKINFVKNIIKLSEKYQLPIDEAKPKQNQIKKVNLPQSHYYKGKKTLLLDLDDTLIFTEKPIPREQLDKMTIDSKQYISISQNRVRKLNIRPHCKQFLKKMSESYEIILFTAATKYYANQIKKILDPQDEVIEHVLSRSQCFNPNSQNPKESFEEILELPHIKDLRFLNRDLSKTVLVDNSIYCFWYQIDNGIPIIPYSKIDQNDCELIKLSQYLQKLSKVQDVRILNKEHFRLSEYEEHVQFKTLIQELYQ